MTSSVFFNSKTASAGLDNNLFWDLSCRTSEDNFHLSEMKIHLPKLFCLVLIGRILCSCNCFGIEGHSNSICPVGQVGWEVQLSGSYFQLSRAAGQSLMSIPVVDRFSRIWDLQSPTLARLTSGDGWEPASEYSRRKPRSKCLTSSDPEIKEGRINCSYSHRRSSNMQLITVFVKLKWINIVGRESLLYGTGTMCKLPVFP